MPSTILLIVGFIFVALAAQHIGRYATLLRLPLITGYLLAGAVVGPFVLGWLSQGSTDALRVVDHVSLAFIAFAAGSELYLKEVRSRLRSISWTVLCQLVVTFALGAGTILLIADYIPFMRALSPSARLAVALMAGAILVARSPSSAIAIVTELRARGPFTKTFLGVTVVMDAVVILLFATSATVAHSLVAGAELDPGFVLRVVLDLLVSLNVGYLVGRLIQAIVGTEAPSAVKISLMLGSGLGVFWLAEVLRHFSEHYLSWPITIEPLLACMIAGFIVTNFSDQRAAFDESLQRIAPLVYLAFFTLVGASLALDVLIRLWPIALALFAVRLLGISLGSLGGGLLGGAPPQHTRLSWMTYVTMAGVGLGLAKEVAVEFPSFGPEFATMIISIIVVSQIVGPPLLKLAIKRVGESHLPALAKPDAVRDALILGVDDQALAVARRLRADGWKVVVADVDRSHVSQLEGGEIDARHLPEISAAVLKRLATPSTDALVAMMGDDELNYRACEIAYERIGIPRIVVRLNDLSWSDKFSAIGALVVEPASAMVNLLDQMVRLPQLASLLMHRDPDHEVKQITVADPDIDGMPLRDLRLPPNVRVLGISRGGHPIVPQGHAVLRRNDEVTLVGEPQHLAAVATRWGY